jgi:hypothetical protein
MLDIKTSKIYIRFSRRFLKMNETTANCGGRSRWTQPFVLLGFATAATGLAVPWLLKHEQFGSTIRPVIGFLPALMWILFIVAVARGIGRLDEMGKRIHLQAASISFLLTVILAYTFVGLEAIGVYTARSGDFGRGAALIWGCALVLVTWRYR